MSASDNLTRRPEDDLDSRAYLRASARLRTAQRPLPPDHFDLVYPRRPDAPREDAEAEPEENATQKFQVHPSVQIPAFKDECARP